MTPALYWISFGLTWLFAVLTVGTWGRAPWWGSALFAIAMTACAAPGAVYLAAWAAT